MFIYSTDNYTSLQVIREKLNQQLYAKKNIKQTIAKFFKHDLAAILKELNKNIDSNMNGKEARNS